MLKQELLKSLKRFLWGIAGMSLSAFLVFFQQNLILLDLTSLSKETKGLITVIAGYLINDLTKRLNKKFNLEGKILGAIRKLGGKQK